MAEVVSNWYCVGIRYSENTAFSRSVREKSTGTSKGTVSLNKQLVVTLETKIKPGTTSTWPAAPSINNTLSVLFRPGLTRTISCLGGRNYYLEESSDTATGWVVEGGKAFFVGYEDALQGVEIWQCNIVSEASDIKRGKWWGTMTPTKFRAMTSDTQPSGS